MVRNVLAAILFEKYQATPIDEELQNEFKAKCKQEGYKMNEVVEILMNGYINGQIQIEKEISYKIHQSGK